MWVNMSRGELTGDKRRVFALVLLEVDKLGRLRKAWFFQTKHIFISRRSTEGTLH